MSILLYKRTPTLSCHQRCHFLQKWVRTQKKERERENKTTAFLVCLLIINIHTYVISAANYSNFCLKYFYLTFFFYLVSSNLNNMTLYTCEHIHIYVYINIIGFASVLINLRRVAVSQGKEIKRKKIH
jgi:hypothetical protein